MFSLLSGMGNPEATASSRGAGAHSLCTGSVLEHQQQLVGCDMGTGESVWKWGGCLEGLLLGGRPGGKGESTGPLGDEASFFFPKVSVGG